MKKIIMFLLLMMLFPITTDAYCSKFDFQEPEKEAYNLKFNYELKKREDNSVYYQVTISNIGEEISIHYGQLMYTYGNDKNNPSVAVVQEEFLNGSNATFEVRVYNNSSCAGVVLLNKTLDFPKYNYYSEREECYGYEEFDLCKKWYEGNFTEEEFQQKLKEYKEKNKPTEPAKDPQDDKGFFEKIIDFYMSHKLITIPLTIILVGVIIFGGIKHYRRGKKKVKLKI